MQGRWLTGGVGSKRCVNVTGDWVVRDGEVPDFWEWCREGQGGDEGNAEPGGDHAVGGRKVAGVELDVGGKSGGVAGVQYGARAGGVGCSRDPGLLGQVAQRHRGQLGEGVPAGEHDAQWIACQRSGL